MSKKKSAINNDHDPLSWLLQGESNDETAGVDEGAEAEPVQEVCGGAGQELNSIKETESEAEVETTEDHQQRDNEEQKESQAMCAGEDNGDQAAEQPIVEHAITEAIDTLPNAEGGEEMKTDEPAQDCEQIVLQEDVSIIHVAMLKESWLPCIDSSKNINIDASAVEDIDTAGLQLLLSFVKTVNGSGRTVSWENPSETMIKAVTETALKDVMGIRL